MSIKYAAPEEFYLRNGKFSLRKLPEPRCLVIISDTGYFDDYREEYKIEKRDGKVFEEADKLAFAFDYFEVCGYEVYVEEFSDFYKKNPRKFFDQFLPAGVTKAQFDDILDFDLDDGSFVLPYSTARLFIDAGLLSLQEFSATESVVDAIVECIPNDLLTGLMKSFGIKGKKLKRERAEAANGLYKQGLIPDFDMPVLVSPTELTWSTHENMLSAYLAEIERGLASFPYPHFFKDAVIAEAHQSLPQS